MAVDIDDGFYHRADAFIDLANEHCATTDRESVSASLMYSSARFNAWVSARGFKSGAEMGQAREAMLNYFCEQYRMMLEDNLERTFAADPYRQMGGYVKRALGLKAYFKAENPQGSRLQTVFVQDQPLDPERTYMAAFITSQGVPHQFGRNRQKTGQHAVAAMRAFLQQHRPLVILPHDTFVVV